MTSFSELPTELYETIFSHIPYSELQQVVLAVTRAIPLSAVPLQCLFESICIKRPQQAIQFYRRLRYRTSPGSNGLSISEHNHPQPGRWVKEFSLEIWDVDADIIVNIVPFLSNLQSLNIWVGPSNFAPEHLEELFAKPILTLRSLALRFRPYVEKATYYQFLKGAYFDSTLAALSRWPPSRILSISIAQDPPRQDKQVKKEFAQPLVFFRLDLSVLLKSPAVSNSLASLRIRIPLRPVARSLCNAATPSSSETLSDILVLPDLEFLDLSTCGLLESELDMILARFMSLKHVVVDDCSILRGDLREGEGSALGKRCALIGVRRAKEREKILKAWVESRAVSNSIGSGSLPSTNSARPPPKKGRKGLSTATISFRDPKPVAASPTSQSSVQNISTRFAQAATISPEIPSSSSQGPRLQGSSVQSAQPMKRLGLPKIRVLPCLPALLTISIKLTSTINVDRYSAIRAEFEEGWAEGIAQLAVTRARLRTSAGNGYRVMRITSTSPKDEENEDDGENEWEQGLYSLEDVDRTDPEAFAVPGGENKGSMKPPVLCFAGPGRGGIMKKAVAIQLDGML